MKTIWINAVEGVVDLLIWRLVANQQPVLAVMAWMGVHVVASIVIGVAGWTKSDKGWKEWAELGLLGTIFVVLAVAKESNTAPAPVWVGVAMFFFGIYNLSGLLTYACYYATIIFSKISGVQVGG